MARPRPGSGWVAAVSTCTEGDCPRMKNEAAVINRPRPGKLVREVVEPVEPGFKSLINFHFSEYDMILRRGDKNEKIIASKMIAVWQACDWIL